MRRCLLLVLLAAACRSPAPPAPAPGANAVPVQAALEQRLDRQLAALAQAYTAQNVEQHARLTAGALELLARYDADTLREISGPLLARLRQHAGPYLGVAIELAWRLGRAPTGDRHRALEELRQVIAPPAWQRSTRVVIGDRTLDRPELIPESVAWPLLLVQVSPLGESLAAGGAGPEGTLRLLQLLHACTSGPPAPACDELRDRVVEELGGKAAAAPVLAQVESALAGGIAVEPLPCVLPGTREALLRHDEAQACREPLWMRLLQRPVLGPATSIPLVAAPGETPVIPGLPHLAAGSIGVYGRATREGLRLTSFRDAVGEAGTESFRVRQQVHVAPGRDPERALIVARTGAAGTVVTRYAARGTVAGVSFHEDGRRIDLAARSESPLTDEAPCAPGWDLGASPSRLEDLVLPQPGEPLVSDALSACVAQRHADLAPCGVAPLCARGDLDAASCTCTGPRDVSGFCTLARCQGSACDPASDTCRAEAASPDASRGAPTPAPLGIPDPGGAVAGREPLSGTAESIRAAFPQGVPASSNEGASGGTSSSTSTSP
jgi:hypothetical protein